MEFHFRIYSALVGCQQKLILFGSAPQVRDTMLAKEDQTKFEEYLSNSPNADAGIDFTVTVLTTGFWPSYKYFNLNLPREMVYMDLIDINC